MIIIDPIIERFLTLEVHFINGLLLRFIPDGMFTENEIEFLRDMEKTRVSIGEEPIIANFLPDDQRPKGVKKL